MTTLRKAEEEVERNPDDETLWRVYADALQAVNDPRGELIAVQLELAGKDDATLWARQQELLAQHGATWLGPEAMTFTVETRLPSGRGSPLDVRWRHGFPSRVVITGVSYKNQLVVPGGGDVWRLLAREPRNLRFVSELEFGAISPGQEPDWSDAVEAVVAHPPPRLHALSFSRGDYWDISSTTITGLDATFWATLPHLRRLSLELGQVGLGDIDAPSLEAFSVVTGSLDEATVDELARAKWPKLEQLVLYFGSDNYGGLEDVEPVARLLKTSPPAGLRHLGLCNAMFTDELPALLLDSAWLPGLRGLDLSHGTLGPDGARVLLEQSAKFRHLTSLDLSHAFLDDETQRRLRDTFPTVTMDDVQDPSDGRYVSISE